jgi:hypothetical protein
VCGAVDEDPEECFRRTVRFADLARELGADLPPFRGPLVAFDPAPEHDPRDPVYLGGDLQAVHPDAREPRPRPGRDDSLDRATITLLDGEGWLLDIPATEGVWCTRVEGAHLDCAPYLAITDGRGRLRTWLVLPPPRTMIGIAHLWLGAIPKAPLRSRRSPRS